MSRPHAPRLSPFPRLPLLALVAAALTVGCGLRPPLAKNVILISIDTLRRDHLGCYGYDRDTSPYLDAFCREAAVFDQAISHAPSTLPSHASMLTSLLPQEHGASYANRRPLPDEVVTLADVLKENGFRTASFNDGGQIAPQWNLGQGFDVYASHGKGPDTFDRVVGEGLAWLDQQPADGTPFFLFLHTYQVHHPYTPSAGDLELVHAAPYDGWLGDTVEIRELDSIRRGKAVAGPEDAAFIVSAYDAEIRSMDRALGRLLDGLRERGRLDDTVVVFTSDHGEELGEHGTLGWHSHTLYDELLRVPLVIRLPGERWAGRKVLRQVRLIDAAPTILDAVGIGAPPEWGGVSLLRILRGEEMKSLLAVSERDTRDGRLKVFALRTGRWKLYEGRLCDLRHDPEELYDSLSENWELVEALKARLGELTAGAPESLGEPVELDSETTERLKALGYV